MRLASPRILNLAGALALIASLTCIGGAATAQIPFKNVQLMGRINPGGGFSDVWGFVGPAGKEYALVCADNGTWVMDCTDPTRPRNRGAIPASPGWIPSAWRDVKTYAGYAYVISEGGAGMQIINVIDPTQPRLVKTWGTSLWPRSHNMFIDETQGVAYVVGTPADVHVINLANDPENPTVITTFTNGRYIHNLHVQDGYAYMVDLLDALLIIVDVSNLPFMRVLGSAPMPAGGGHNAWASPDGNYCLTTNETRGGPIACWDVSDKTQPKVLSQISLGPPAALPHDVYWRDAVAHASYYTEGYRVIDFSDPTLPVEVGHYDTFQGASRGFNGAWGCYPFQPSGNVYITDMVSGLWIFRPDAMTTKFGQATPGTGGLDPEIDSWGAPYLGNSRFSVSLSEVPPLSPAFLLLGAQTVSATLPSLGLHLNVLPAGSHAFVGAFALSQGEIAIGLPLPPQSRFAGSTLHTQFFAVDPQAPSGISGTLGLTFEMFSR